MPALNFQARFAPLVESGEKRQTIRAYRKDGRDPQPGDTLYLYTRMRTKYCRKLGDAPCLVTRRVSIFRHGAVIEDPDDGSDVVFGEEAELREILAEEDGFDSWQAMADWFEKTHGLPFKGLLIRWGEIER